MELENARPPHVMMPPRGIPWKLEPSDDLHKVRSPGGRATTGTVRTAEGVSRNWEDGSPSELVTSRLVVLSRHWSWSRPQPLANPRLLGHIFSRLKTRRLYLSLSSGTVCFVVLWSFDIE